MRQDTDTENKVQHFILLNESGAGIADYYLALNKGSRRSIINTYSRIIFAPSNQAWKQTIQETSSQFFVEQAENIIACWNPEASSLKTYTLRAFRNWYFNQIRKLAHRANPETIDQITQEITMNRQDRERTRELWSQLNYLVDSDKDKAAVLWRLRLISDEEAFAVLGVTTPQSLNNRFRKVKNRIIKEMN